MISTTVFKVGGRGDVRPKASSVGMVEKSVASDRFKARAIFSMLCRVGLRVPRSISAR
jgi:hypothetical protein